VTCDAMLVIKMVMLLHSDRLLCISLDLKCCHNLPFDMDLALSDCHLFEPVKKLLGVLKFTSDSEMQSVFASSIF